MIVTQAVDLMQLHFTIEDAQRAANQWGLNCGPAAVAAIAGMTPDELRPHLGDFESKGYTTPTLMLEILKNIGVKWTVTAIKEPSYVITPWPEFGLARIQWEGPWTDPGVPIKVRYRHTHWVGACQEEGSEPNIFDVNCMCSRGWVPLSEWSGSVVPWLLNQIEPKAYGSWHLTHAIEVRRKS